MDLEVLVNNNIMTDIEKAIEQIDSLEYIPNQYEIDNEKVQDILDNFQIMLDALRKEYVRRLINFSDK